MTRPVLVSAGEILWDQYPDYRLLGGAPFNLAAHAARLGFHSYFLSAVGEDELGREALDRASALGVAMRYTRRHPELPTGVVDVELDAQGHPSYHLRRPSAWEEPVLSPAEAEALLTLRPAWLVCGTLQQTCPQARAVRLALPGIPLFYDVNLRPGFEDPDTVDELLRAAAVVKCNSEELAWLGRELGLGENPAPALLERYPAHLVCVTMGPDGCALHTAGGTVYATAPPITAIDTVGAGDAFSAAFLHALAQQWTLEQAGQFANRLGALVASRKGAIPDWTPEELGGPCRI